MQPSRRFVLLAAAVAFRSGQAQKESALDAAAGAMGGKSAVMGVRTLVMEGRGQRLYFDQAFEPYARTNIVVTKTLRSFDFANRRWLLDDTRKYPSANPASPPIRVRGGIDGA